MQLPTLEIPMPCISVSSNAAAGCSVGIVSGRYFCHCELALDEKAKVVPHNQIPIFSPPIKTSHRYGTSFAGLAGQTNLKIQKMKALENRKKQEQGVRALLIVRIWIAVNHLAFNNSRPPSSAIGSL